MNENQNLRQKPLYEVPRVLSTRDASEYSGRCKQKAYETPRVLSTRKLSGEKLRVSRGIPGLYPIPTIKDLAGELI